jgi:stress-induced morphogen
MSCSFVAPTALRMTSLRVLATLNSLACPVTARASSSRQPARMQSGGTDVTVIGAAKRKLAAALSPTSLNVVPTYGDPNGAHVSISVVSDAFEGMGTLKRHRLVYKAIWEELENGSIHAVDELVAKTPDEAV